MRFLFGYVMVFAKYVKGVSPDKIRREVMRVLQADETYQAEVAKNTLEYKKHVKKEIRAMERDVRATKREIEAQQAIGGDTAHLEAMKRRQTIEYHRFCKEMEIRPKDNRLGVVRGSSNLVETRKYKKEKKK